LIEMGSTIDKSWSLAHCRTGLTGGSFFPDEATEGRVTTQMIS
jgi:hypothetical protein